MHPLFSALSFAIHPEVERMSYETFEYHFGMRHISYVINMNKLHKGTEYERSSLEAIIRNAPAGNIYDSAAQVWSHTFFRRSIEPNGGGAPNGALASEIVKRWSSFEKFKKAFQTSAVNNHSSGWTWLVKKADGSVDINSMGAPGTLFNPSDRPLLCLDVTEHAYYPEYREMRPRFVADFLDNLVNWNFAEKNFDLQELPESLIRDYQNEEIY